MHAGAPAKQPGGKDPRIIEDHKLVAPEKLGKLGEETICELAGGAAEEEKAGGVAALERALGNELAGKVVVELVEPHGGSLAAKAGRYRKAGGHRKHNMAVLRWRA
jgi:hypothetical protein